MHEFRTKMNENQTHTYEICTCMFEIRSRLFENRSAIFLEWHITPLMSLKSVRISDNWVIWGHLGL